MGFYLQVLFDVVPHEASVSIPDILRQAAEPGYSLHPCEPSNADARPTQSAECMLYAENYHRVYAKGLDVCFYHEIVPPPDHIAQADARVLNALLDSRGLHLRRWERGENGWDDDDRPYSRVLDGADGPTGVTTALAALHKAVPPNARG